jgi:hypothetical protein
MHSLPQPYCVLAPVVALFVVLAPTSFAQGDNGFLRGAGRTDVAFTYSVEEFEHFWVDDHRMRDAGIGTLERESWNLWVAHGIRDDLDLVATATYVRADTSGSAKPPEHSNLQDGTLGAKWRVFEQQLGPGSFSALAAPAVKIPLAHYAANEVTAIGDGQIDYRLRAIVQYRFDFGAYVAFESGYDVRSEGTRNEVPIHLSVGATVFDRLTITPFMSWVNTMGGKDIGRDDFPDVEEDSTRGGVSGYLRLTDRFGATGGCKTTFQGSNTGDSWSWWLGLVLRF